MLGAGDGVGVGGEGVCGGLLRWGGGAGERGVGTVWVVAFMAVIWVGGVAALAVGGVRAARHRGDAAADLAALAGAAHVASGRAAACGRARDIAAASGARLRTCTVRGDVVEVRVVVRVKGPGKIGDLQIVSRARAGPVGDMGVT
ncbi:Rv3654c family TadE-like protein [Actinomadura rifamycini]|uniref:Rv3654c family TadE-like protein n=1 Tax=Actinomadura rifamycini TaxID=31962 RepID=UPI0006876010